MGTRRFICVKLRIDFDAYRRGQLDICRQSFVLLRSCDEVRWKLTELATSRRYLTFRFDQTASVARLRPPRQGQQGFSAEAQHSTAHASPSWCSCVPAAQCPLVMRSWCESLTFIPQDLVHAHATGYSRIRLCRSFETTSYYVKMIFGFLGFQSLLFIRASCFSGCNSS